MKTANSKFNQTSNLSFQNLFTVSGEMMGHKNLSINLIYNILLNTQERRAQPASYPMDTGDSFPGSKAAGA
jgi:hypothetical protein